MAHKPAQRRGTTAAGGSLPAGSISHAGGSGGRWRQRLQVALHDLSPREVTPQRLIALLLIVIGYTAVLSTDVFRAGITWKDGDLATRSVYADRTVTFVDETATAQLRAAASAAVPKHYANRNPEVEANGQLGVFFGRLSQAAQADDPAGALRGLSPEDAFGLSYDQLRQAARLGANRLAALSRQASELLLDLYRNHEIHDDAAQDTDLQAVREKSANRLNALLPDPFERQILQAVITKLLRPNRTYDVAGTEHLREQAGERVEPVRRTVNRGELVVQSGATVTAEHLSKFQALGLIQPKQDYRTLVARLALVALVVLVLGIYVRQEQPDIYFDLGKLGMLNFLAIGAMALFRVMLALKTQLPMLAHPAIFCGATTGMLITALLEYRVAFMMTAALALFLGLMLPGAGLQVAIEAWLAGRIGCMALHNANSRRDLSRAAVIMAGGGMVIAAVMQLPQPGEQTAFGYTSNVLVRDLIFGLCWGLLSFLVAQGLMPLLERLFGVVTPFRLLELTNTSSPVLAMLRREARGTFDASLTIGDMAAEACEAIGADALIARAAGYHHDIGKMRHPTWFVENQFGGENIHERLEPTISAKAIKSHVTEGLLLADEHSLPKPLRDVIAQHHGTSLISFFYYQAKEKAGETGRVAEEQFRYDGPRPQFRESGVIMLADGIEAAVRAASGHGPMSERRIHEIVHRIVDQRLKEGQLDECPLTLRDLTLMADSFCTYLKGMYHGRIDYPQPANGDKKGDAANGAAAPATPATVTTHVG